MSSLFPTFRAVESYRDARTGKERRQVREFYSEEARSAWLAAAPLYVVRQREDVPSRADRPAPSSETLPLF